MRLRLKDKKKLKSICFLTFLFLLSISVFIVVKDDIGSTYDYKALDLFYKQAVKHGYGPKRCDEKKIIYLIIDDAAYNYFGKNYLDRSDLVRINAGLENLEPAAVIYDIVFARKSTTAADQAFARSLEKLNPVFLPSALSLSLIPKPFAWASGQNYSCFRSELQTVSKETGISKPYYAVKALLQNDIFSQVSSGSGDISAYADGDGVYRHISLIVKVDQLYYPSLSLAAFLHLVHVPFDKITVDWGKSITIPAVKSSLLQQDVVVPIDYHGRIFIPFVDKFGNDFEIFSVHDFLEYFKDDRLKGNLSDIFQDSIVLISDIATGTSDIGYTPLEPDTSLVTLHASVLNGLFSGTFYAQWSKKELYFFMISICLLMIASSFFKSPLVLYATGSLSFLGILVFTWVRFIHFKLFPVFTAGSILAGLFILLSAVLAMTTFKERKFIKNTFAKYVPKSVVKELLDRPELVKIGGEEQTATVLFTDIANFTTTSEKLPPKILVGLLNEYFAEMSAIIFNHGGIIDKFLGDAIMAEFGIPVHAPNHADQAVQAALEMQKSLAQLRQKWVSQGFPAFYSRIGINTDNMIVGNIGSPEIFDYTVIGDAVNLASRLEGVNKRYGTAVIISENTYNCLSENMFRCRLLDLVVVKGKSEPIKIYEVYGRRDQAVDQDKEVSYNYYNSAFEHFLAGEFQSAKTKLSEALLLNKTDQATLDLIARVDRLIDQPLPDNWDGSVKLTEK